MVFDLEALLLELKSNEIQNESKPEQSLHMLDPRALLLLDNHIPSMIQQSASPLRGHPLQV